MAEKWWSKTTNVLARSLSSAIVSASNEKSTIATFLPSTSSGSFFDGPPCPIPMYVALSPRSKYAANAAAIPSIPMTHTHTWVHTPCSTSVTRAWDRPCHWMPQPHQLTKRSSQPSHPPWFRYACSQLFFWRVGLKGGKHVVMVSEGSARVAILNWILGSSRHQATIVVHAISPGHPPWKMTISMSSGFAVVPVIGATRMNSASLPGITPSSI